MNSDNPRVLIVEDASNWRTTLETLLKPRGFTVIVAANVLEAASALQQGPFAAAILDVRLDSFDDDNREGLTTVLMAAHALYPQMSFVVMSSYYNETEVRGLVPSDVKIFYFDKNNFRTERLFQILEELAQS
ncbi:MAG: hypothetical protein DKINENOH_00584 [bacterium]|nr:hypothetical protein [bacterium]